MNGMKSIISMVSELVKEAERQAEESAAPECALAVEMLKGKLVQLKRCRRHNDKKGFYRIAAAILGKEKMR